MPAGLYFPKKAVFVRVGPQFDEWGSRYRNGFAAELIDDVALIGGLVKRIEPEDYREVVWKLADAGYRASMAREKYGLDNYRLLAKGLRRNPK